MIIVGNEFEQKIDIAHQIKEFNNFDSIQIHLFEQISKPNTV